MRTYYSDTQVYEDNLRLVFAQCDFDMQVEGAKLLGISLEEYQEFEHDMMFNTIECTPEEIEQMYFDYCAEYNIPYEQTKDYACIDRTGW